MAELPSEHDQASWSQFDRTIKVSSGKNQEAEWCVWVKIEKGESGVDDLEASLSPWQAEKMADALNEFAEAIRKRSDTD